MNSSSIAISENTSIAPVISLDRSCAFAPSSDTRSCPFDEIEILKRKVSYQQIRTILARYNVVALSNSGGQLLDHTMSAKSCVHRSEKT